MSHSNLITAAATLGLFGLVPSAAAEGFYVDGGYLSVKGDIDEEGLEKTEMTIGLLGGHYGYDYSDYLGVEAELFFGIQNDTGTFTGVDYELSTTVLAGAYAKAQLPIGNRFRMHARAGYVGATSELSLPGTGFDHEEETEFDFAYGLGAAFDLFENTYIRADLTRYGSIDDGLDGLFVGIGHRF